MSNLPVTIEQISNPKDKMKALIERAGVEWAAGSEVLDRPLVNENGELIPASWMYMHQVNPTNWNNALESILARDFEVNGKARIINYEMAQFPYAADGNKLLNTLIDFSDARFLIRYAINIIYQLQDESLNEIQRRVLAKHALHTIAPIMRCFEIPALISEIEELSLKALDEVKYEKAKGIVTNLFGNNVDLEEEREKIDASLKAKFPNATLHTREKGLYSIYKKVLQVRSPHDVIGSTLVLDDAEFEGMEFDQISGHIRANILPSLTDLDGYTYDLDEDDDTFKNPREDKDFRVVKVVMEKPGAVPFELQITTKTRYEHNRRRHRTFKLSEQDYKRIGLDTDGVNIIGDYAIYLLNQAQGLPAEFMYPQTETAIAKVQDSVAITTTKGNHTIFVPKDKKPAEQIKTAAGLINSKLISVAGIIKITTKDGRLLMLDPKTGMLEGMTGVIWSDMSDFPPGTLIDDYTAIEAFDSERRLILTINDVLNAFLHAIDPADVALARTLKYLMKFDRETGVEIMPGVPLPKEMLQQQLNKLINPTNIAEILAQYPLLENDLRALCMEIILLSFDFQEVSDEVQALSYTDKSQRKALAARRASVATNFETVVNKVKALMIRTEIIEQLEEGNFGLIKKGFERISVLNALVVVDSESKLVELIERVSKDEKAWDDFLNIERTVEDQNAMIKLVKILLNLEEQSGLGLKIRQDIIDFLRNPVPAGKQGGAIRRYKAMQEKLRDYLFGIMDSDRDSAVGKRLSYILEKAYGTEP